LICQKADFLVGWNGDGMDMNLFDMRQGHAQKTTYKVGRGWEL
jgi:hypothetical protein